MVSNGERIKSGSTEHGVGQERDERPGALDAEKELNQELANLKAENFDLRSECSELQASLAKIWQQVADAQRERDLIKTRFSTVYEKLKADCLEKAEKLAEMTVLYQQRLDDTALLGHAIASKNKEIKRIKASYDHAKLRTYILTKLGESQSQLKTKISQSFFSRARRRAENQIAQEIDLVAASNMFDAEWYLELYSDVAHSSVDPLRHYVLYGAYELRDPGPAFSTFKYHKAYMDVTNAAVPALLHYLRNGKAEGRRAFKVGEEN